MKRIYFGKLHVIFFFFERDKNINYGFIFDILLFIYQYSPGSVIDISFVCDPLPFNITFIGNDSFITIVSHSSSDFINSFPGH